MSFLLRENGQNKKILEFSYDIKIAANGYWARKALHFEIPRELLRKQLEQVYLYVTSLVSFHSYSEQWRQLNF